MSWLILARDRLTAASTCGATRPGAGGGARDHLLCIARPEISVRTAMLVMADLVTTSSSPMAR
jgi:hypothetical protein